MLPRREYLMKGLVWNCCVITLLLLVAHADFRIVANGKRSKYRHHRIRNAREFHAFPPSDGRPVHRGRVSQELVRHPAKHLKSNHVKHQRHFWSKSRKEVRTEHISQDFIDLPSLTKLLNPPNRRMSMHELLPPSDHLYRGGVVRERRLYCRVGIGYHLEIRANGKVVGRHKPTRNGILKIFSVSPGIVGIQVKAHMRYLCMNRKGRLYSSKSFGPECQFRETIEANYFNTYASNSYSDLKKRKGYYLALNKKGKVRSNKKVSPWQKRAHWLPRTVDT